MLKKILASVAIILLTNQIYGQGCVAVRHFGSCSANLSHNTFGKGDIQAGINYRYFKSFRHFRGTHEEADRVSNGTEVINHSNNWEYSISYWLSGKTNLAIESRHRSILVLPCMNTEELKDINLSQEV